MDIPQILKQLGACPEAIEWVEQQPEHLSPQQLYESLDSVVWCGWLCDRLSIGQGFTDAWETDMRGESVYMKWLRADHDLMGWVCSAEYRAAIHHFSRMDDGIDFALSGITYTQEEVLIRGIYRRKKSRINNDYYHDLDELFRVDNFVEKHRPPWAIVEQALQKS